jgi:hypothetical protein
MPTYGSVQKDQSHHIINSRVVKIKEEIERLRSEQEALSRACDHHFVPEKDALNHLDHTKVSDVYRAVTIGPGGSVTQISFKLVCAMCFLEKEISISDRCPSCASKTKTDYTEELVENTYFDHYDHHAQRIYFVSCTCCDFRAAGLEYDR